MSWGNYLDVDFVYTEYAFKIGWLWKLNYDDYFFNEFGLKKDKFVNFYVKYCKTNVHEIHAIIERIRQAEYQPGSQKYLESERKIYEMST